MLRREHVAVGVFCLAISTLTGCPNKSATEAPKGDTATVSPRPSSGPASDRMVRIASLSPDPDKPLRAGTTTKLTVGVEYAVPAQGGSIGLVVQDANNKSVKSNLKEISGGSGKIDSDIEFVVPNTKHIEVHVPLYVKGENKSSHVAVKKYQIIPK